MPDSIPTITDQLLDRLVDDELSADERRRLLAALDDEPSGWRRTALAFVEAQAWRGTLGKMIPSESLATAPPTGALRGEPITRGFTAWRPLALAAGLFIAFTLGMFWRVGPQQGVHPNGPGVAQPNGDPSAGSRDPMIVQHIDQPSYIPPDDALMLTVGGNGRPSRQVSVPLVDASDIGRQIPSTFASAVPDSYRRRLERSGYQVDSRRRYAPIPLQGGRRMYVPVEDTRIVPVNLPVY